MKILYYSVVWLPILTTLGLVLHCSLLLFGIDNAILRTICSAPPVGIALFYYLSRFMKFCWVHRSLIVYAFVVNLCIILQQYDLFGITLNVFRCLMLCCGVALLSMLTVRIYGRKKKISEYCPQGFGSLRRKRLRME